MIDIEKLDISNFLPHRPPFLMVDKLLSIDDKHVITVFEIKKDTIFVSNNLLNEVGLVECAAQACSSIVGKSYFAEDDIDGSGTKLIGFISTIKNVSIHSLPSVGTTIKTIANLVSRFDSDHYTICTIKCSITGNKKQLLSCELNLFIQEVK